MSAYASPQALWDRLGSSGDDLDAGEAVRLLTAASDAVDAVLRMPAFDAATGRRILVTVVAGWQWDALARATVEHAVAIYRSEQVQQDPAAGFASVKGPDFAFSGRIDGYDPYSLPKVEGAALDALYASGLLVRGYALGRATA